MDYTDDISKLFLDVMNKEINKFRVKSQDIRIAFRNMAQAYMTNQKWMYDYEFKKTDYNNAAHRCAYLHKYAMLHTSLMCDILQSAFRIYSIKQAVSRKYINLCSLGGGPGTDIVALLFLLDEIFGLVQCDVTIMDISGEWQHVFETIVSELQTGSYGMSAMVAQGFFNYQYRKVNLLGDSEYPVRGLIGEADIITMVKFVSAAACGKTREMIRRIFRYMKLGAMVLFIDNAAGGFHEMLQEEAGRCGLESVFGPLRHHHYKEPRFCYELHGATRQFETKVAVEMWMKRAPVGQIMAEMGVVVIRDVESRTALVEIDGLDNATVQLNSQETESGWRCCSMT